MFLNIILLLEPNYDDKTLYGTVNKKIPLLTQFKALYKSIKLNLKEIEYQISVVHSTEYSTSDLDTLRTMDIDILQYKENEEERAMKDIDIMVKLGQSRYSIRTKKKGTHRLLIDVDILFLKSPEFDFNVDFQFGFAGALPPKLFIDNMIKKTNLADFPSEVNWDLRNPFWEYNINQTDYKQLVPMVNNGVILIKENSAKTVKDKYLTPITARMNYFCKTPKEKHYFGQWIIGISLVSYSADWKPFSKGINYLIKSYDIEKFGKDNIQILHYCGENADDLVLCSFPMYFSNI